MSLKARLCRWTVAVAACWCLWINHYSRDLTGALEKEIEADVKITKSDFQTLNTVYFLPNILMPTITGLCIAKRFGAPITLVGLTTVNLIGNSLIAVGASYLNYLPMIVGRIVTGLTYESIEMNPLTILVPLFPDSMGTVTGLFTSFLRCGSVANFIMSPMLYRSGGLSAATWVSAAFAGTGLLAAITLKPMSQKARALRAEEELLLASEAESAHSERPPLPSLQPGWIEYVIYVCVGASLYSSIVPFWFYGGGFIRDRWKYDLAKADFMVLLTEATMAVLAPFVGKLMDCLPDVSTRVGVLAVAAIFVPISFTVLANAPESVPPAFPMALLSLSVAFTIPAFWCLCSTLVLDSHMDLCAGLLGSSMNLGGTLLPILMAKVESETLAMMMLAGCASFMTCFAVLLWARLRWLKHRAEASRTAAQFEMTT